MPLERTFARGRVAGEVEVVPNGVVQTVRTLENHGRTVLEPADNHRAGSFFVIVLQSQAGSQLLLGGLEAAHVLLQFPKHEIAPES